MSHEYWEGDVIVIYETEDALLVDFESKEIWIPKSQIHNDSEIFSIEDGEGVLIIPEWLAKEKDML